MRTARDWQRCGRSQFMIPSRELWQQSGAYSTCL